MTKIKVKKVLSQMSKEALIDFVLNMYEHSESVKSLLDNVLTPNPSAGAAQLEKYKKVIAKEFYPRNPMSATHGFANAKRAVKEFRDMQPDPMLVADLMMDVPELACRFTSEYGDMWEQYYTSTATNFEAALKFMSKHGLLHLFQERAQRCVKYASPCGWGFADEIQNIYTEYYKN